MNSLFANFLDRMQKVFAEMSLVRKLSMGLVLVMALGSIAYVVKMTRASAMEPIFTNLNAEDIGSIVSYLDRKGVRYVLDQDQRTVKVPSPDVLTLRMELAGEGLPRYGGVGFELFDKDGFGMTEFEQRVNFQRALEGELARTIGVIREVEKVRVHLVLPEKSFFADSQQQATASVILKIAKGTTLAQGKVSAITNLVAGAVEGLSPENVTILDNMGQLLSAGGGDAAMVASSQIFAQKLQIERTYERRIVEMLTPVVGISKVIARVSADVDFTRTESTSELVDPLQSAVVSESRTNSKRTEAATGGEGAAATSGGSSNEGSENIAYEVSKTVKRQVTPMGTIKNLNVAILVDGTYEEKDGERVFTARPQEELKRFEDLIKSAIGFTPTRGDQIKVESISFQASEDQLSSGESWYSKRTTFSFLISVLGNVLVVAIILLVFFFVIRPLIKSWRAVQGTAGGPYLLEAGAAGGANPDVRQIVQANPTLAVQTIRQWLK